MSHIHWYPGHIAKARRDLKEKLNLVDVVLEIIDARLPLSSKYSDIDELTKQKPRIIILNKIDLVSSDELKNFQKYLEETTKKKVFLFDKQSKSDTKKIINEILKLFEPTLLKMKEKGIRGRAARIMVVGLPNVGKSSIINRLINKQHTKTGAVAGVTRQIQWVRVHDKIELLDTPGVISTMQNDQSVATKLAFVNSIGKNSYDNVEVAEDLVKFLSLKHFDLIKNYYNLDDEISLSSISKKRNWILKNNEPDINRTADFVLSDFRLGRIGKIILDELPK